MVKPLTGQIGKDMRKTDAQKIDGQSGTFQARVDYVAKALRRGSGGPKFKECLEQHDSSHIAAILMKRAERSQDLRNAIIASFDVNSWNDVPWHKDAKTFIGMSAQQIGMLAGKAQDETHAKFAALSRDTDLILY